MKILITNHHLQEYTGSEVSTFTLSKYLKKSGHDVTVYSKYLDCDFIKQFRILNIPVVSKLDTVGNEEFDIAHVQHNISAYEVRYYFPKLPMVIWIHGVLVFLELPPLINLHVSKFLVNNKEAHNFVHQQGVNTKDIIIFRNIVDPEEFYPITKINRKPRRALIISNKITVEKETLLKRVLDKKRIKYQFIGKRFKIVPNSELPKYMNRADIVFTVGLGAMESMLCGRPPILYDYNFAPYDDGLVTSNNFNFFKEFNFSGRATKNILDETKLNNEIEKYDYKEGELLRKKALALYGANTQIKKIISIYKEAIRSYQYVPLSSDKKRVLSHLVNIIFATKFYADMRNRLRLKVRKAHYRSKENDYKKQISKLKNDLIKIQSSKTYIYWQRYNALKRRLARFTSIIKHV